MVRIYNCVQKYIFNPSLSCIQFPKTTFKQIKFTERLSAMLSLQEAPDELNLFLRRWRLPFPSRSWLKWLPL